MCFCRRGFDRINLILFYTTQEIESITPKWGRGWQSRLIFKADLQETCKLSVSGGSDKIDYYPIISGKLLQASGTN